MAKKNDFKELPISISKAKMLDAGTCNNKGNKKDGYRQQNVRQRQRLISIIDYDICMTFY